MPIPFTLQRLRVRRKISRPDAIEDMRERQFLRETVAFISILNMKLSLKRIYDTVKNAQFLNNNFFLRYKPIMIN